MRYKFYFRNPTASRGGSLVTECCFLSHQESGDIALRCLIAQADTHGRVLSALWELFSHS